MGGGKRVGIIQSNYIPWKGYFDFIHMVDEFILFDDVQYTRRDWRNRNKIKTRNGPVWLTIPVQVKGNFSIPINQVQVSDPGWSRNHWETIRRNYTQTPFFHEYEDLFAELYLGCEEAFLSRINRRFIDAILGILGIRTRVSFSMDYQIVEGKTERLVSLCEQAGAEIYLSGPAAKDYLDEDLFARAGIRVEYMDYSDYPAYEQAFPPFEHGVSIIDLIFSEGPRATSFMKSFR